MRGRHEEGDALFCKLIVRQMDLMDASRSCNQDSKFVSTAVVNSVAVKLEDAELGATLTKFHDAA
jgi:hypothetical protein